MQRWKWRIHNLINDVEDIVGFQGLKAFNSDKSLMFSCSIYEQVTLVENPQFKIISFLKLEHWYLIHSSSAKAPYKGTVVNRKLSYLCMEGEITLTTL